MGNIIQSLPDELFDLANLIHLELGMNNISKIPESINKLKQIETISLVNNYIKILPPEIADLLTLKELDLSGNLLEFLPAFILKLGLQVNFDANEDGILLQNNPISYPPISVIKKGNKDIEKFFKENK